MPRRSTSARASSSTPVSSIERDPASGRFLVRGATRVYESAAVIAALGARPRLAGFEGEAEFTGRGVSYCATCDGMFYRGKQVFVIGGGNSAAEEALFLARIADKVTMVVRKDHLRAQATLVEQLEQSENVEIRYLTSVVSVSGSQLPVNRHVPRQRDTARRAWRPSRRARLGIFCPRGPHT